MKFDFDLIRKNVSVYNQAKEDLPVITDYETQNISYSTMCKLGLSDFAHFYTFLSACEKAGFNPIMKGMTWRRLKPLLVESTHNVRLKKFISNRTQRQFNQILADGSTFDRLLNGRWISKPSLTRRGRRSSGRRSGEHIESFRTCIVPIMNYIIDNGIDVYDGNDDYKLHFQYFIHQPNIESFTCWYTKKELNLTKVPKREIEVTRKLVSSLADIVDQSKVDFRKLNSEYIIQTISDKIRKLMTVKEGTKLKCITDYDNGFGRQTLTKDKYYEVIQSSMSDGYVTVLVRTDTGSTNYFNYSYFEDIQSHRNDLLDSLFDS